MSTCILPAHVDLPKHSRQIDVAVHRRFVGFVLELPRGPVSEGIPIPRYSTSLDAVIDLIEQQLPGWSWRACQCSVTDDAWLMPDFGHPDHGAAFQARWPDCRDPLEDGPGLDISTVPQPRGAMAMLACLIEVLDALETSRQPDQALPAALAFFTAAALDSHPRTA